MSEVYQNFRSPSYLSLYIILVAAALVSFIGANLLFILGSLHGSKSIHRRLLNSILGATYQWLDVTPVSRGVYLVCTMLLCIHSPLIS